MMLLIHQRPQLFFYHLTFRRRLRASFDSRLKLSCGKKGYSEESRAAIRGHLIASPEGISLMAGEEAVILFKKRF
ncbi:MAG: hypothetical protein R3D66_05870 [Alphaproteobacteria bacterium]